MKGRADPRLVAATVAILDVLVDLDDQAPSPEGVMYAALLGTLSLAEFQQVTAGMVAAGWATREAGHCLRITEKGAAFAARCREAVAARGGG